MLFDQIIDPIDRETFFRDYWNKQPLLIPGKEGRFNSLPSVEQFPSLLMGGIGAGKWHLATAMTAQATIANRQDEISFLPSVPLTLCPQLFNSGYSLCFGDVSGTNQHLGALLASAASVVPYPTENSITAYATPKYANGIVHFDSQHVFFIQRGGSKYWKIAREPAVMNPISNFVFNKHAFTHIEEMKKVGYEIRLPSECGFQDVCLKQGDVLYLPPGYYHCQHTRDEISFHYTLTFEPRTVRQVLLNVLSKTLMQNNESTNCDVRAMSDADLFTHVEKCLDSVKVKFASHTAMDIVKTLKGQD